MTRLPASRGYTLPIVLAGAGALLPPTALASWLRGGESLPSATVVLGLWLFKGLLILHGVAALVLPRLLPHPSAREEAEGTVPWRWLLALVLGGVALRLPGLGAGLWYDEIQTLVQYVRQPMGMLVTTFDSTNQHLLYSVLARVFVLVGGESATTLRLPAVLLGAASLAALVVWGRRWLPPREGWLAAILLLVSYHHIWFSQNARGYTGLLLGTLAGTSVFLDLLRRPGTHRQVWTYAVIMALTVLTHVTALVVVAGHAAVWLWQIRALERGPHRWGPLAALALSGSLALLFYGPVLPQFVATLTTPNPDPVAPQWKEAGWFVREAIGTLVRGVPAGALVVPVGLGIGVAGVVSSWRHDRVATALMLLPMMGMAALLTVAGHNLWPRFFFFGAGFAVLLGVRGTFATLAALLPGAGPRLGQTLLVGAALASTTLLPRAWAPKQDYVRAAAWIAENRAAGDVVAVTDMTWLPLTQWLGREWPRVDEANALRILEPDSAATWVLTAFPIRLAAVAPSLEAYLAERYTAATVIPGTVGGGAITIHVLRPPAREPAHD